MTRNEWVCGEYISSRQSQLTEAVQEHLLIVLASVALGLVLALPLALTARRFARLEGLVVGVTSAIYSIPSLALFSLLIPVTGLGGGTVILGLGLYSLTVLVRAFLDGLREVPSDVVEAGRGMGYSNRRLLFKVELPIALPTIMSGLRVATVSTVALATVGAILDFGGLGNMLIAGKSSEFKAEVLTTSLLCVLIAIILDLILVAAEKAMTPWTRGRAEVSV